MTTWQLESTGRYPQALKDHLATWRPNQAAAEGRPASQVEKYLESWDWLDRNGFVYHNVGHARNTGQYGFVDCSGGVCLCRNAAGVNLETDATSYSYSRLAHNTARPQFMIDHFGPGRGYQITPEQAKVTPSALRIVGRNEGQDYSDSHGHIESEAWPYNTAVGAFSHASGVGYRSPFVTGYSYYCLQPFLSGYERLWAPLPPPKPTFHLERDMIIQKFHLAPDGHTRVPVPAKDANGRYHIQRILVRADGTGLDEIGGASLNNDKPFGSGHRVWFPPTDDPYHPFNPKVDKVIAVEDWDPRDGTVPGVFVQFSNGRGRAERFS